MKMLPLLAAALLASLAACTSSSSSSSASAPVASATAAAAPKAATAAPGTVTAKAACEALAAWENSGSGSVADDAALRKTFQDTTQPLSGEFSTWVSDIKSGSSLVNADAALVSLECTAEGITVFPSDSESAAPPAAVPASSPRQTVTFEVSGSYAQVTYGPAGSSASGAVPMKVTEKLGSPLYYAVTAQLQGGGSVSCEIDVDGKAVSKATATGGYN
ncbi:MAG TPA: hypothetical protein VL551_01510, partial [Actinospica sp.]|nr:hypothetical protein [Actinospica sp.]